MRKGLIKIIALFSAFIVGVSSFINFNNNPSPLLAAQHLGNYADFTYEGDYYKSLNTNGEDGLNGSFRKALTSYIYPKAWYVYSGGNGNSNYLSGILQSADEDPTNSENMVYFYTRDSVTKNPASTWNREHVWPQSLSINSNGAECWGTSEAGTDILHLRPTYNSTNSSRGNMVYGDANKSSKQTYNGMTYGYKSGNYFEPLDEVKGDVARILMYIWTTYTDHYHTLNLLKTIASYDTLLKWHILDKPDALEGHRNDVSETSKQKNRNPFVDHPEYAWRVFGNVCSNAVKNSCMETYPSNNATPKKEVTSITISGTPTKKNYYVGDKFDPTGLTVTAKYSDSTSGVIPNSDCLWLPNPLTLNTTTITCKYGDKTATYTGISVSSKENSASEYSVVFKNNGEDDSAPLTSENYTKCIESNTLVKSVTTINKIYAGAIGLKLGSSKEVGVITFNIKEEARNNIDKIVIESTRFKEDAGLLVVKVNNSAVKSDIVPGEEASIDVTSFTSIENLTISTTTKRAYLNKITFYVTNQEIVEPEPSSSEPPVSSNSESSSSEAPISSETESSSSETPVSSNSESSSSEATISSEVESSIYESSISSDQQESSKDIENSSSSVEQKQEEKKGCGGLITSLSLVSLTSLIGLVFIFSKRKK